MLWIALLLAALLSLPRVFGADYEDGSLDILATGPLPLELVAAAKALAHWISTSVPLALLAPVLGILLNLDLASYPLLVATMLVGTPAVSFIGAVGAALTLARPPRRAPDRAPGAAALRADADLRHGRDQRRCLAPAACRAAVPYPYRHLAGRGRAGAAGGRGGAAGADAVRGSRQ